MVVGSKDPAEGVKELLDNLDNFGQAVVCHRMMTDDADLLMMSSRLMASCLLSEASQIGFPANTWPAIN